MKKISFFVLLALLASCGQESVDVINSTEVPVIINTENSSSTNVGVEQNSDKNAELRVKLEKMSQDFLNTGVYVPFDDFRKVAIILGDYAGVGGWWTDEDDVLQKSGLLGMGIVRVIDNFVEASVSYAHGGHTEVYAIEGDKLVIIWAGHEYPVSRQYCEPYLRIGVSKDFDFMKNCDKEFNIKESVLNATLKKDQEFTEKEFLELTQLPNSSIESARVEDIFGNDNEYVTFAIVSKEGFGYLGFYERKDGIYKFLFSKQEPLEEEECNVWSREGIGKFLCEK